MLLRAALRFTLAGHAIALAVATVTDPRVLDACPGYAARDVVDRGHQLTADLVLNGKACNVFGTDIEKLKLEVTYESSKYRRTSPRSPTLITLDRA